MSMDNDTYKDWARQWWAKNALTRRESRRLRSRPFLALCRLEWMSERERRLEAWLGQSPFWWSETT
jgi:hypothetical protein